LTELVEVEAENDDGGDGDGDGTVVWWMALATTVPNACAATRSTANKA
jgi:hypothetical protein